MKIDWWTIRDWAVRILILTTGAVILGFSIWSVVTDPGCCCR
jgi:nitrate/nitrite transporter NarK